MKSTKDAYKNGAPESTGKKENKSKTDTGKEAKQNTKSQAPGTTGRRTPPPPKGKTLKQDES